MEFRLGSLTLKLALASILLVWGCRQEGFPLVFRLKAIARQPDGRK